MAVAWRDVVFQYDGTFDGFLCCVFESYVHKEFPIAFSGDEECWSLYEVRYVVTERAHAQRVYQSILRRSKAAADVVRRGFLTCLPEKESHLYALIRKFYDEGTDFLRNTADPVYYPVAKALRHMSGELEKLRGFVRFSDYNGVLGSEIEPKTGFCPCCGGTSATATPTRPSSSTTAPTGSCWSTRRVTPASCPWTACSLRCPAMRRCRSGGCGSGFMRPSPSRSAITPGARTPSCPSAIAAP